MGREVEINRRYYPVKMHLIRGIEVYFDKPHVMGVLNCTPDSFSDGGKFTEVSKALSRIEKMVSEGAFFIDVGGESTRPGSEPVSEQDEIQRVIPVLKEAIPRFPQTIFSIDTTKYDVAREALNAGAHYVNDVSGLRKEPRFAELCASFDAGLILMHSVGDPKTMQQNPQYDNVLSEVRDFLIEKAQIAHDAGVSSVIIDPGIGFGKTLEHNLSILKGTSEFVKTGYPVLIGASRKSMFAQLLDGRGTDGRLAGTISAHFYTLMQGASVIRVHDVLEAVDSVKVFLSLRENISE